MPIITYPEYSVDFKLNSIPIYTNFSNGVYSMVLLPNDLILVAGLDSENICKVAFFNTKTKQVGELIDTSFLGIPILNMVYYNKKVYCGGYGGYYGIFNIETKQFSTLIPNNLGTSITSQLLVGDNIYVSGTGGKYATFNTINETFSELIPTPFDSSYIITQVLYGNKIFISAYQGKYASFDITTNTFSPLITKFSIYEQITEQIVLGNKIFICTNQSKIYSFNPLDNTFEFINIYPSTSHAIGKDNKLYWLGTDSEENTLYYIYDTQTGILKNAPITLIESSYPFSPNAEYVNINYQNTNYLTNANYMYLFDIESETFSERIDYNWSNGLKKIRISIKYSSDEKNPTYGIISQEGSLEIFDTAGFFENLIEQSMFNNIENAIIKFQDKKISTHVFNKITEIQNNLFSITLSDSLMDWNDIIVLRKENIEENKTAKDLILFLQSKTKLEIIYDETTESLLESIEIKYYYWEESTLWEFAQKICDLAQLYIYMRNDGKVVVISQKRINELKVEKQVNPIVVPYTKVVGSPFINRIDKNKIESVSVLENVISTEFGKILELDFILDDDDGTYKIKYSPVSNAKLVNKNGEIYLQLIAEMQGLNYLIQYVDDYAIGYPRQHILSTKNNSTSYSGGSGVMPIWLDKDEFNFNTYDEEGQCYQLNKNTSLNGFCYTFNEKVKFDTFKAYTVKFMISQNKHFLTQQDFVLGEGKNNYKIKSNEFYTTDTKIDGIKISEHNSNQILLDFTGKQTISFRMATDTLYYKAGTKAYDINLGETPKEFDLIQLKQSDGTYSKEIWQITKVEHEAGGSKWINIEGIEI